MNLKHRAEELAVMSRRSSISCSDLAAEIERVLQQVWEEGWKDGIGQAVKVVDNHSPLLTITDSDRIIRAIKSLPLPEVGE